MRALRTDLRYAGRLLAKNPTFTAIVVITLALGIGTNSAVFSVVNAVMLRSLPYRDQDRLVVVWEQNLNRGLPHQYGNATNLRFGYRVVFTGPTGAKNRSPDCAPLGVVKLDHLATPDVPYRIAVKGDAG